MGAAFARRPAMDQGRRDATTAVCGRLGAPFFGTLDREASCCSAQSRMVYMSTADMFEFDSAISRLQAILFVSYRIGHIHHSCIHPS